MSDWKNIFPKENIYFETENGILYKSDCLEILKDFPLRSIDLVVIDPPYGINKDNKWDYFKYKKDYYAFIISVYKQIVNIMKLSATFYWFHINMEDISNLMVRIQQEIDLLKFIQFIVWNKRFKESKNYEYLNGFLELTNLNTFPTMAEYLLKYRINIGKILKNRRLEKNISQKTISSELKSLSGGITGWYSNIETGKYLPNKKTIKPITKYLGFTLKDLLPVFNNQKQYHSVWNFEFDEKKEKHPTQKPVKLIENIIIHSSNEKDIVLDCFIGSGTIALACEKLNRKWIGIEINEEYCNIIKNRIQQYLNKQRNTLF